VITVLGNMYKHPGLRLQYRILNFNDPRIVVAKSRENNTWLVGTPHGYLRAHPTHAAAIAYADHIARKVEP
jgi:hypothetical protein